MRLCFRLLLAGAALLPGLVQTAAAQPTKFSLVAPDCYVHTTYLTPYPTTNGLVVRTSAGAVLIDTGWNAGQARQLRRWVRQQWRQPIALCIVTHSHRDRAGGANWLHRRGVRVVSTALTAEKLRAEDAAWARGGLPADTTFTVGGQTFRTYFPGAGHVPDNIVVWLPQQQLLVGGCLIKSTEAQDLGNLADANPIAWVPTMQRVISQFPEARLVIPGHQAWGDAHCLQHTLDLLKAAGH
ncbi:subclass B1 metallo-beta-lactamase [uncultured Hymenobacter sp.]|uniref:subclass B1 metallo-beta-lactamase n=1 Tax=uncultured Hymenobacter sp. TaxID=170016 RepID=UPI0035CC4403